MSDKVTVSYENEQEFNKKIKALRKYCPLAHKQLVFKVTKGLVNQHENGKHCVNLRTSNEFKFVYGQISLVFTVKDKKIVINDLLPSKFFLDGHRHELGVYKGIYYRNNKDKFKIDLLSEMKKGIYKNEKLCESN